MTKYLIVALVLFLLFRYFKTKQKPTQPPPPGNMADLPQDMVRCARCGVHLPKLEAVQAGTTFYCSEAHRLDSSPPRQ